MAKKILKNHRNFFYRNKTQIIMHKFLMMLQHRKMFHITGCLCHSTLASSRDLHFFFESDEMRKNILINFLSFQFDFFLPSLSLVFSHTLSCVAKIDLCRNIFIIITSSLISIRFEFIFSKSSSEKKLSLLCLLT